MTLPVKTRPASQVFAPTDANGNPRGADMGETQTWAIEMEVTDASLDERVTTLETNSNAVQLGLADEIAARQAADAVEKAAREAGDNALGDRIDGLSMIAANGIKWSSQAIRVRSTSNVDISTGLVNGTALNGVTLATGDNVFLGLQTDAKQNGVYTVVASGAASRAAFANTSAELERIGFTIQAGSDGAGERWTLPLDAASITIGTTTLNFALVGLEVGYAAEVVAARGGAANLSLGLDARGRQAKTRAPNLIFNGNLDNFGAGVTLFSDLLSNPAAYTARVNYEIGDPTLRRLGCKHGLYVKASAGLGNAVCSQLRVVGGYMFVSCLVYNPTGNVWDFGTNNGPTASVRYRDGSTQTSTPLGGMSSFEQIAPGVRRYFAELALNANKPTLRVEIGTLGSTTRGADYVLTGFWASHSRNSGLTVADTAFPDWTVTEGRRPGIPALKNDLADPFHSVNCIAIGDSITWGIGSTGIAETEPRSHELTDPRNNSTSNSWVNMLCRWMGAVGAGGQGFTDATILTDGIAEFRQKQMIDPADNRIGYWSGATALAKIINVSSGATSGIYVGIAVGAFIDFEFTGDELDVYYGTQTADAAAAFTVSIDGTVVATQGTYDASSHFGNKVTVNTTFERHYVRIATSAGTAGVNIDGIVHNRLVRLQNQGISGTWSGEWMPFDSSGLYTAVPVTATHLLIQLGTNDRSLTLGPAVGLYERISTICRYVLGAKPGVAITILCANKAKGDKEVFEAPDLYSYDMSEVRRQLLRVSQEFGLSFVDQYSLTARMDLDGESFTTDNLHPNDAGHLAMYRNIISAIDGAALIAAA